MCIVEGIGVEDAASLLHLPRLPLLEICVEAVGVEDELQEVSGSIRKYQEGLGDGKCHSQSTTVAVNVIDCSTFSFLPLMMA